MSRRLKVSSAQLGPINLADSRASVVKRMVEMLKEAVGDDGDWIEYWLWECNRGRSKTAGWTHEGLNGKMQPMRTLKDLWQAIHYRATI